MLFQCFWLLVLIKFDTLSHAPERDRMAAAGLKGSNIGANQLAPVIIDFRFDYASLWNVHISRFHPKWFWIQSVETYFFSTGYICMKIVIFIIGHTLLPPRGQCHCNGKKYSHFADLWGAFWLRAKTVGLEVKYINHPICRRNCTESFVTLCS